MWRESVRSSTQQGQAAEETVPEVLEARDWGKRAGKLHPTEAKPADSEVQLPGQQRRPHSARKTMHRREKGKRRRNSASSQQKDRTAQFKSVGRAARVQCKREASRTRRAIAAHRSERHCEAGDDDTREGHEHT